MVNGLTPVFNNVDGHISFHGNGNMMAIAGSTATVQIIPTDLRFCINLTNRFRRAKSESQIHWKIPTVLLCEPADRPLVRRHLPWTDGFLVFCE